MNTAAAAELQKYPKFRDNYIRAFDRMLKNMNGSQTWKTGEDVMDWWLGYKKEKPIEGQIELDLSQPF